MAWFLAVVVGEAEIEDEADGTEEESEGGCSAGGGGAVCYEVGFVTTPLRVRFRSGMTWSISSEVRLRGTVSYLGALSG